MTDRRHTLRRPVRYDRRDWDLYLVCMYSRTWHSCCIFDEAEVLRGARAVLAAPGLKAILTENRSPSVVDLLERSGMTEFPYDAFAHRLVPAKEVPMANALFLCGIMSQSVFHKRLRCNSSGRGGLRFQ